LFVVSEEEEGQPRAEQPPQQPTGDAVADDLIARYVGGAPARRPAAPPPPEAEPPPVTAQEVGLSAPADVSPAAIDFPSAYQKRGLASEEQAHVGRAMTLLGNLPKETPQEIKRQIVAASLVAFGVPVDRIIESALLQQRVLDLHVQDGQRETQAFLEESSRRL